uniref:Transmembrane protein n=1 Tax=Caulobacter phage BL57 TaxID=3348355 RepID=A0AB74UIS6_9VIRU
MMHDIPILETLMSDTKSASKITLSGVLLLLGAIAVVLKLVGVVTAGWAAVLIPFYIWAVVFVIKLLLLLGIFGGAIAMAASRDKK